MAANNNHRLSWLCLLLLPLVFHMPVAANSSKDDARIIEGKKASVLPASGQTKLMPSKASLASKPDADSGSIHHDSENSLTYAKDISPIIMNNCVVCHQAGGSAPFSLSSYSDVKKRASTIDAVIAASYMPPWKPAQGYAQFVNERRLSDEERASIHSWIKQGAPSGDLKETAVLSPKLTQFAGQWKNGKPDLIIRMPQPYKVPADGPDIYRCFVFPLNLDQNKFVSHVEFHPGNPKVVHHALFFLDNMGEARKKDAQDPGEGFTSFGGPGFLPTGALGGWAPGNSMLPLPEGIARVMRKGSDLVMQLHLHPDGREELAQGELGIYFSKKKPEKLLLPLTVRSRKIDIAANEKNHKVSTSLRVPADFDLLQVVPHAHLLCKEIKCSATTPDGRNIPLIWIKNWDFNWQEQYEYQEPIHLPEGTVVNADFIYDNSEDNFRNPNHPPKHVGWGEQTTDEMALIFFSGTVSKNEEMAKYMQAMMMGTIKDIPISGVNPWTALRVAKMLFSGDSNPLKDLGADEKKR